MIPLVLLVFSCALLEAVGIQITNMEVPKTLENPGTAIVLDCDYTLTQEEKNADSYGGLVVKWYLNNFDSPVYQWIPGKKPQDLGVLKGRLDVNHRASDNPATMHRALYIRNPTTDLSGDYKCLVSTFNDEDFMVKRMIVLATEKNIILEQTKPTADSVNITCSARGVFPEPKMSLYRDPDTKSTKSNSPEDVTVETSSRQKSYDITAWTLVDDSDVDSPTVFICELNIPEAQYAVRKRIVYYPGMFQPSHDSGAERSSYNNRWVSLVLLTLLYGFNSC